MGACESGLKFNKDSDIKGFSFSRFVPDALSLVGHTRAQPVYSFCSSASVLVLGGTRSSLM